MVKSSGRGSKPGERRGGRTKGTPNKATAEVKALAGKYAPAAIRQLARLAEHAESEAARVSACREILDRAFGKAAQPLTGEGGTGPVALSARPDLSGLTEEQLRALAAIPTR